MSKTAIGRPVPDIELPATGGKTAQLSDYRGHNVVLFFYPKANTPRWHQGPGELQKKQGFVFDLLSDPNEQLCQAFGVIKLKTLYGKEVRGIERSTFLIGADGMLRQEWRKVQVAGHVEEVLAAAKALNKT